MCKNHIHINAHNVQIFLGTYGSSHIKSFLVRKNQLHDKLIKLYFPLLSIFRDHRTHSIIVSLISEGIAISLRQSQLFAGLKKVVYCKNLTEKLLLIIDIIGILRCRVFRP